MKSTNLRGLMVLLLLMKNLTNLIIQVIQKEMSFVPLYLTTPYLIIMDCGMTMTVGVKVTGIILLRILCVKDLCLQKLSQSKEVDINIIHFWYYKYFSNSADFDF